MWRRGQKPRRPETVSRAGSSVSPATKATVTPIADAGPSELVLPIRATSSTSMVSATVSPLARIAGPPDGELHGGVLVLVRRSSSR